MILRTWRTQLGRLSLYQLCYLQNQYYFSKLRPLQGLVRRYSECGSLTLENTFKCYELDVGPPMDVELSRDDALKLYRDMVTCRRMETVCGNMYKAKKIRGFCHLYIGQEAVAVGMCAALRKKDSVITAYRCHAWTILMGVSVHGLMAELIGVRTGCSRGKGGSMHTYADNFYGGNGIVGAQVPLGVGIALAHQYRGDGGICLALYGDGACNQGQIFEVYNIAKLLCLPCIFVCENNHYGMGTHVSRHSAFTDLYMRGQYIPGLWVDGNQVLAVRSATHFAIDYAVNRGPIVLEMSTYRYEGHSMSDPGISYRSREEVKKSRKERDPITSFRKQILELCLAKEEELKAMDSEIRKEVDEVGKQVQKDKEVGLEELCADVYMKNFEPRIRGISGYDLNHIRISEVCLGKPKATPKCEMKDVPVGDAALLAEQKKAAELQAAKKAKAAAEAPKKEKGDDKKAAPPGAPPAATAPAAQPPAAAPPAAAPPKKT